jgi:CO/xanthine dehydrogenase FAD-binding subunit
VAALDRLLPQGGGNRLLGGSQLTDLLGALGVRLGADPVRPQSARGAQRTRGRILRIEDLFRNDGIDYLGKRPEEILTAIRLPAESAAGRCGSAFWKLRRRGSIDFAVLSAAAAVWLDRDGTVSDARLYLGAVASRPLAVEEATRVLVGSRLDHETIAEAARLARKAATPMDNTDYLAQWRGVMVERYSEAALREAAGLPVAIAPPPHPPL